MDGGVILERQPRPCQDGAFGLVIGTKCVTGPTCRLTACPPVRLPPALVPPRLASGGTCCNHWWVPHKDPVIRRDMLALVRQAFEGRYEVEREIGKGGNARIFLAREPGGQSVALKILHRELLVCGAADRVLRER